MGNYDWLHNIFALDDGFGFVLGSSCSQTAKSGVVQLVFEAGILLRSLVCCRKRSCLNSFQIPVPVGYKVVSILDDVLLKDIYLISSGPSTDRDLENMPGCDKFEVEDLGSRSILCY
jgi:hypothetical protein